MRTEFLVNFLREEGSESHLFLRLFFLQKSRRNPVHVHSDFSFLYNSNPLAISYLPCDEVGASEGDVAGVFEREEEEEKNGESTRLGLGEGDTNGEGEEEDRKGDDGSGEVQR